MYWLTTSLEILILFVIFYALICSFEGTLGARIIKGYIFLFVVFSFFLFFITSYFNLHHLKYIISHFMSIYLFIALMVIFQREFRMGVLQAGQRFFGEIPQDNPKADKELIEGMSFLAKKKVGAIIAIERKTSLNDYLSQGVELDAKLSKELLWIIFWKDSLLHDGGIIVKKGRILAASCIFPLSEKSLPSYLGTRHRAGMGLSEVSDALVLVISEEKGEISLCFKGQLYKNISQDVLASHLKTMLTTDEWMEKIPSKEGYSTNMVKTVSKQDAPKNPNFDNQFNITNRIAKSLPTNSMKCELEAGSTRRIQTDLEKNQITKPNDSSKY